MWIMRHAGWSCFTYNFRSTMSNTVFLSLPVLNWSRWAKWKNVARHICGEQARRTVERIAYLWSRCSIEDRLFVLLRLALTSAQCSSDRCIYLWVRDTRAQIFWARPISNVRFILLERVSTWKSDFPRLYIKRAVVVTGELLLIVSHLGKSC